MCPCHQDYIFHPADSESKLSGPSEPGVDMFDYPFAKLSLRDRVLAPSFYGNG
jgi:hypothetical protein